MSIQVNEMEEELRELSEELANSIRREMELEEQIERLQAEGPNALDNEKRTSDYFSDSGTNSSARDMDGADAKEDELRHVKRQSAQEKAQMKVSVSQRVQEERNKRKALEEHVKNLEAHIQTVGIFCARLVLTWLTFNSSSFKPAAVTGYQNYKMLSKTTVGVW